MCTLCDSTWFNMMIKFVPHVSGDGFNGGSDSYLQFRDTRAPCLLKLHTTIERNCQMVVVSRIWCGIAAGNLTPTIILNNPVCWVCTEIFDSKLFCLCSMWLFFRIWIGWWWWLNIMYFSFTKVSIFFTTVRNWQSRLSSCRSSKFLFSVAVNTQQWNCMWCL